MQNYQISISAQKSYIGFEFSAPNFLSREELLVLFHNNKGLFC